MTPAQTNSTINLQARVEQELQERLTSLPERVLLGAALLQRRSQGLTNTEAEIVEATLDAIAYQKGCNTLRMKLEDLSAIPARIECLEFGL